MSINSLLHRSSLSSFVGALLSLCLLLFVAGCGETDSTSPEQELIDPVSGEYEAAGGVLETADGDYALEIPEGALSDVVTLSLDNPSGAPATDIEPTFITDGIPVAVGISNPEALLDTLYLTLPAFSDSASMAMTALYLPSSDEWVPLPHDTLRAGSIRLPLAPEQCQIRGRDEFWIWVYLILFGPTPDAEPELHRFGSAQPDGPAVVLIHGLGITNPLHSWTEGNHLVPLLQENVGEVWWLGYPWHKATGSIDEEVIEALQNEFGSREIYIIAHSKGGLLARRVIRQMEDSGLNISKAVFMGTPHYGSVLNLPEVLAEWMFPDERSGEELRNSAVLSLATFLLSNEPGVMECLPLSLTIVTLSIPMSFDDPPQYACVIGTEDRMVSPSSADLTRPEHLGLHEDAELWHPLVLERGHAGISRVMNESGDTLWQYLASFLEEDVRFALIEAGTFQMGSPEDELGRYYDEDQHWVTLTHDFFIQTTEVTNRQYAEMTQWAYDHGYCGVEGYALEDALDGSSQVLLSIGHADCEIFFSNGLFSVVPGKEDHPVKFVSWYGAVAYCDWLSLEEGLPRAYNHETWQCNGNNPYNAQGYRLPTEAEWEYACRAGTSTAFANGPITYTLCSPLDPVLDQIGWYCGNDIGPWTSPVGLKMANSWNIFDMHGNLWEWCNDWYSSEYYNSSPSVNPTGPANGMYRVRRGGAWDHMAHLCRSARRGRSIYITEYFGFRPARSAY